MLLEHLKKVVGIDFSKRSTSAAESQGKGLTGASTNNDILYAIGDIHGRQDLLSQLMELITTDISKADTGPHIHLVFLGDYIDRGPDSRGVLDDLIAYSHYPGWTAHFLRGNHEEGLLNLLRSPSEGAWWYGQGGETTLESYGLGLDPDFPNFQSLRDQLLAAMPRDHLEFLINLEPMVVLGDYAFVHAGVRPGVPLNAQSERDLLWIREPFLSAPDPGVDKIVVHGHTPIAEVEISSRRIGIDTGAWSTGRLSAVRIYQADLRIMTARGAPYTKVADLPGDSAPA